MHATKIQSAIIMARTLLTTLYYSIKTILISFSRNKKRKVMDGFVQAWSTKLLSYPKISYQIINPHQVELLDSKHYILMSNHASHYDIPLIFKSFDGSIRMLAKKELFRVPVWGRAMRVGEFIAIDRNNREQAIKDLALAREKMESGIALWVAPEGTRSRTGKLQAFKKGGFMLAIQMGATIIPIGIRGSYNILPPKTWSFQIGQHAEVHIGEPIDASTYSISDRDKLMQKVAASIRELSGEV